MHYQPHGQLHRAGTLNHNKATENSGNCSVTVQVFQNGKMGVSHNPEVVNTHKADYLQKTSMKQKAHYVSLVSWEGRKKA